MRAGPGVLDIFFYKKNDFCIFWLFDLDLAVPWSVTEGSLTTIA